MISNRYFRFLSPADEHVERLINTAIFILNPKEKWRAHVTLAGPFPNRRAIPEKNAMFGGMVSVMGVGTFFNERQCTVFLKTDGPGVKDLWNKPDFEYNPHMTIYDGKNYALAKELANLLGSERLFFHFPQTIVYFVNATSGQGRLDLLSGSFSTGVKEIDKMDHADVERLYDSQRIQFAVKILKRVKLYSQFGGINII